MDSKVTPSKGKFSSVKPRYLEKTLEISRLN